MNDINKKIICSKNDIILTKINNDFNISFKLKYNKNIFKFLNSKLFILIGELNKEIIEDVKVVNKISNNENDVLYVFKRFGSELGISKKHLLIKTLFHNNNNNNIEIIGKNININKIINNTEPIDCHFSKLIISNINNDFININYDFNMTINEDLPIYMNNIIGILMKKIFLNLKIFIDNFVYQEKDEQVK